MEHRSWKVVYRRYASLFFLVGIDDEEVRAIRQGQLGRPQAAAWGRLGCAAPLCVRLPVSVLHLLVQPVHVLLPSPGPQNELGILEMIHCVVETLDKWWAPLLGGCCCCRCCC